MPIAQLLANTQVRDKCDDFFRSVNTIENGLFGRF